MARLRADIEALLDKLEPRLRSAFLKAVDDLQQKADVRALQRALGRGDIEAALDALNLDPAAFRDLQSALEAVFAEGGDLGAEGFPVTRDPDGFRIVQRFDVRNPQAEAWLRDRSSTRITGEWGVIEGIRSAIRPVLSDSLEQGRGPLATALDIVGRTGPGTSQRTGGLIGLTAPQVKTVNDVRLGMISNNPEALAQYLDLTRRDRRFDRTVRKAIDTGRPLSKAEVSRIVGRLSDSYLQLRGEMIARTEALAALSAARHEAFRQGLGKTNYGPEDVVKIWDSAGDGRVRDSHAAMDGDRDKSQRVRGLDGYFTSPTGARMRFPGDTSGGAPASELIGCRCIVRYEIDVFRGAF